MSFLESNRNRLGLHHDIAAPERDAHDRLDDGDAFVEELEILGFVRRTENVRIGGVRLLHAHAVREAGALHVLRHLLPAAELVDEALIEPRLVDAEIRIRQQPVAVEPLDVVAFERAAVAPDVDVVFLHGDDEHRAGDGAAERRSVEVRQSGGRNVEGAGLEGGEPFGDQLRAAVDEPRLLGAVLQRASRDVVVVRLVGLTEVRRVRVGNRSLRPHPVQRRARVEAAGKRNADALAGRKTLKNVGHSSYCNRHESKRLRPDRRVGTRGRRVGDGAVCPK
jgi:hypothetical protein